MVRKVGKLLTFGLVGFVLLSLLLSPTYPIHAARALLGWGKAAAHDVKDNLPWPEELPPKVIEERIKDMKEDLQRDQASLKQIRAERSKIRQEIDRLEQEKEQNGRVIEERATTLKQFAPLLEQAETAQVVLVRGASFLPQQVHEEAEIHLANLEAAQKHRAATEEHLGVFQKLMQENLQEEREHIFRLQKREQQIAVMEREFRLLKIVGRFHSADPGSFAPREQEVEKLALQIRGLYREYVVGISDDPAAGQLPIERELNKKAQKDSVSQTLAKIRALTTDRAPEHEFPTPSLAAETEELKTL